MKRWISLAGVACIAGATAVLGAGTASAADTGTVYVVHSIPGTPVDVYVDGTKALDDFQPATAQGPLQVPAGAHQIAITAADAADDSSPVLSGTADVVAGSNVSLVAHLDADGAPSLTAFNDDVSAVPAGQARLVVRHTAAAPAVDVRAGGTVVLSDVTNGQQGALVVPAGTVSADVVLAGTDTVAIGPADVDLAEGTATFVHAIGSASDKTLALVSFTVDGLGSAPSGVPAGTGPQDSAVPGTVVAALVVVGAGLALVSARRLTAGRAR
ncbi:DUF4397 domain-containing protein [Nakamurella endophytica]|uniref:Lipoprotein n=1 Tax=Nakamurella endophytica TaxID=1748367 RepID=A0A917T701_9ACTN|nr:DUF4397 domain-containing protein [Nakamurella endophytica]GGM10528.1 lipoprotein [Nakamurella endophytica]